MIVSNATSIKLPRFSTKLILSGVLLLLSLGCKSRSSQNNHSADSSISSQACLEDLNLQQLDQALVHCNNVVKQHQNNPEPLNDRYLIYTLLGQNNLACQDIYKGLELLQQQGESADPMVRHELTVRKDSCMQYLNMTGKG